MILLIGRVGIVTVGDGGKGTGCDCSGKCGGVRALDVSTLD